MENQNNTQGIGKIIINKLGKQEVIENPTEEQIEELKKSEKVQLYDSSFQAKDNSKE